MSNTIRDLDVLIGRRTLYGLVDPTRSGAGGYVRLFTIVPGYDLSSEPTLCEVTAQVIEACGVKAKEHNGNIWIFVPGTNFDRLLHVAELIAMKLGRNMAQPTRRI